MNPFAWRPSQDLAPEAQVALDMARRALLVAPFWITGFALVRGGPGAASSAFALAVVVVNLALSALMASTFARISPAALGAASLAGYPVRLVLVVVAVFAARNAGWFDVWSLGLTLAVGHLGLLIWEVRSVNLSFTYPALAPRAEPSSGAAAGATLQETP